MKSYYRLTYFGLPQVLIFHDGSMYDERRKCKVVPQPCSGHIEIANPKTHARVRLSYDKLYGYYFRAPWRTGVDHRWLKPFGFSKYYATKDGRVFSTLTWDYLVGNMSFDGYLRALIKRDDGKSITIGIHRLVAMVYIPNPDNKPEVNHKDGNKLNNRVENLEWVWSWENVAHALKTELRKSVLNDDTIRDICRRLENRQPAKAIARALQIPNHCVRSIKEGCHFRISKDYDIPRCTHFGAGHRSRNASDECYRIARTTHGVNLQPSQNNLEGSETISKESRAKLPEVVATQNG